MYWNHRVTRRELAGEVEYAIREVYYDSDNKIISWTADVIGAAGDSTQEVAETLQLMLEALTKPVVDITDEDHPKEIE